MEDGILQSVIEVVGEVVLAGVLMVLLIAAVCLLATPFILITAACDRCRFWPSVKRRYHSVAMGSLEAFSHIL